MLAPAVSSMDQPGAFLYADLMIRVRVRQDIDARFIWYMLLAPQSRNHVRARATGSAGNMPKINQKVLNEVPVPLPPDGVRQQILGRIAGALAVADAVTQRLDNASDRIRRTSQAVLAKAFRGELSAPEYNSSAKRDEVHRVSEGKP